MRPTIRRPHDGEKGFILVGVVTFMLALTILGLSLFALSSYEAQFFSASSTREQALQNCESGMSLVQTLLEARYPRNLENARLAVGQFGITNAIAYQQRSPLPIDTVSTGPVRWDSTVVIVVTARSGSAERTVHARYIPLANVNPYQRLITANGQITYNGRNSSDPSTFRMEGRVWQTVRSAADTAWTRDVTWTSGRPVDPTLTPIPQADAFVDSRMTGSLFTPSSDYDPNASNGSGRYDIEFISSSNTARFYRSPAPPPDGETRDQSEFDDYSFYSHPTVRATVRGISVWVVPQGICLRRTFTVRAEEGARSSPVLVIVAKANRRDRGFEDRGIWLQGALHIETNSDGFTPRVYLVSEGDIGVTHHHSVSTSKEARTMNIVAGGAVELGGPIEDERFWMGYASSMDATAEQLLGLGALPPAVGGSATAFGVVRGQWRETTPR